MLDEKDQMPISARLAEELKVTLRRPAAPEEAWTRDGHCACVERSGRIEADAKKGASTRDISRLRHQLAEMLLTEVVWTVLAEGSRTNSPSEFGLLGTA